MPGNLLRRLGTLLGPVMGLIVVVGLFVVLGRIQGVESGAFLTEIRLRTIAADTAMVAVAGLGMTIIILAGGIDLSAGTMLALASVVTAYGLREDWPWPLALAAAMAAGAVCGSLNGLTIAKGRIVPFIATLGTMMVWHGIGKLIAENETVRPNRDTQIPEWLLHFLSPYESYAFYGLPVGGWVALGMAVLTALVLSKTVFGRHVKAIGSNEQAARLSGLPVDWLKIVVYAIGGMFFGIAGICLFSRMSIGDPGSGLGIELDVIAAVIIGGGSLAGGRASVAGTLSGAAIMSVISSGSTYLGYSNPVEDIALGVIIVVAVAIDRLRQKRSGGE